MNDTFPRYSDLDSVFKSNDFLNRAPKELEKDLQALCVENNKNTVSRDTIRALTINHIQTRRLISGLNERNGILQKYLFIITIVATLLGIAGLIF